MLDTFAGLPVHVLLVHLVVVGAPLMALLTVLVAARPAWRRRFAWPVVVADAALSVVVFVTAAAGRELQQRLGGQVALEHAEHGDRLRWLAVGLVVAAVLVALAGERRAVGLAATVVAVVAAVAVTVGVVLTGHSGTESVWRGVVESTDPG
ncbi:MAG: DUF2231 domain-containing protein [Actinomycetes bacterium]